MKKQGLLLLFLMIAMSALITGCGKKAAETQEKQAGEYDVYYSNVDGTALIPKVYRPEASDTDGLIEELMKEWDTAPDDVSCLRVRPDNISYPTDYLLSEEGLLIIYFDQTYQSLTSTNEILFRASLVKTLIQVPTVKYVEFYVKNEPLTDSEGSEVGYMNAETFVDNTGGETTYYQTTRIPLYFTDASGKKLVKTTVDVVYDGTISLERLVVEQLIKGPGVIDGLPEGTYYPTLPDNITVVKTTTSDGICYVDLSEEFLTKRAEVSEDAALYSIVNSLCDLPNIKEVEFRINGSSQKYFDGVVSLNTLFEPKASLVEEE